MTASMILWTLELLDWVHHQLLERWPEARLRGSAPDITPEPYRIRFRSDGAQYWLVLSPDAILHTGANEVASLLEANDWISTLKVAGGLSVDVTGPKDPKPILIPWPAFGPEVNPQVTA